MAPVSGFTNSMSTPLPLSVETVWVFGVHHVRTGLGWNRLGMAAGLADRGDLGQDLLELGQRRIGCWSRSRHRTLAISISDAVPNVVWNPVEARSREA